jgi:hypothetical protein
VSSALHSLDASWAQLDPMASFAPMVPGVSTDVGAGALGSAGIVSQVPRTSHEDPMFWFGLVLAVTLGFVGASTHLRVGPFKVSGQAGNKP